MSLQPDIHALIKCEEDRFMPGHEVHPNERHDHVNIAVILKDWRALDKVFELLCRPKLNTDGGYVLIDVALQHALDTVHRLRGLR
jgi:hypothetical protein